MSLLRLGRQEIQALDLILLLLESQEPSIQPMAEMVELVDRMEVVAEAVDPLMEKEELAELADRIGITVLQERMELEQFLELADF
jgi:hypothetical protein